jgi:hypothetical protein
MVNFLNVLIYFLYFLQPNLLKVAVESAEGEWEKRRTEEIRQKLHNPNKEGKKGEEEEGKKKSQEENEKNS